MMMIDHLAIPDVLDAAACAALREELRATSGSAAALLSGEVRPLVRRVTRIAVPGATAARLTNLLMAQKGALEQHFGLALKECEPPQFLRYQEGDFFVPHQDGNTPLIHDDSRFRKVSVVLFLSAQADKPAPDAYGGGALVLHGPYTGPTLRVPMPNAPGTLVAYRAETTHEVTPVTHGERFTIASWFR
jgi:SM-20-related protein